MFKQYKDFQDMQRVTEIENDLEDILCELCILEAETTDKELFVRAKQTIIVIQWLEFTRKRTDGSY